MLVLAGPATTSYTLTATDPSWQATTTADGSTARFRADFAGRRAVAQRLLHRLRRLAKRLRHLGRHAVRSEHGHGRGWGDQPDALAPIDERAARRVRLGHRRQRPELRHRRPGQQRNAAGHGGGRTIRPRIPGRIVAPLPQTLYGESAVSDGAGHIYTFGGVGANGAITNARLSLHHRHQHLGPVGRPACRSACATARPCSRSNGLIYVIGGQTAAGATATVESYNIATNTWNRGNVASAAGEFGGRGGRFAGSHRGAGRLRRQRQPARLRSIVSQEFTQPDLAPTITSSPRQDGRRQRAPTATRFCPRAIRRPPIR